MRPHKWIPSTLGHGEAMCEYCLTTNREAAALGILNECDRAPAGFECPDCQFSSVQPADYAGSIACPLCAGDNGHDVAMRSRPATDADKPEGFDARKDRR